MPRLLILLIIITIGTIQLKTFSSDIKLEKNNFAVNIDKPENISFDLNDVKKEVYLSFNARIASKWKSGACPAMQVYVNDIPLQLGHLVNKGDYFRFRTTQLVPWKSGDRGWTITYYAWDFKRIPDKFAHSFVFDISKLVVPGKNNIKFENMFYVFKESHLDIKDLGILFTRDFPISKYIDVKIPSSQSLKKLRLDAINFHRGMKQKLETANYYKSSPVTIKPSTNYAIPYKSSLNKDGFNFEVNGNQFSVQSEFRASAKEKYLIGPDQQLHWGSYKLSDNVLSCESDKFKLSRKINKYDSHIEIRDSFTNKTDHDLPLTIINTLHLPELKKLKEFRISGIAQKSFTANTNNVISKQYAMTPTVYLGFANAGLGVVLEDDAYRNQYSVIAIDNKLNLADDMFYLKPHGSYTFVWKIFLTPQKGYYNFLNALRAEWKLYQNIPGLFGFVYSWKSPYEKYYGRYYKKKLDSSDKIKEFFSNTGITIPCLVPHYPEEKGKSSMIYSSEYLKTAIEASKIPSSFIKSTEQAGVNLPFLIYTDVHLLATNKNKMLGSDESWQELYKDSIVKDQFGKPVPYRTGKLYHVMPLPGSKAARQIAENVDYYLNKAGFKGLFLDEWAYSRQRISYAHSDGMSALLDKNCQIKKKIAIIPIICKEFHLAFAKKILERKGILFANQFDCTYDASQLPISHFAEPVDFEDYLLRAAQAGRTPLSLNRKRSFNVWEDVKGFLKFGVLTCYYAGRLTGNHVLKKVFPITPKEIGPGYVIGEKKIVTMLSGKYTFGRNKKLQAFIYNDPKGLLEKTINSTLVNGKHVIDLKLNNETQVVVIIEE